jgi:hypothetical protein
MLAITGGGAQKGGHDSQFLLFPHELEGDDFFPAVSITKENHD